MKNSEIMHFVRTECVRLGISPAEGNIIAEETLGISRQQILTHPANEINDEKISLLKERLCSLCEGRPLQYILGHWEFMGRDFLVGEGVLIPREDTRAVVSLGTEYLRDKKEATFIDLGSGSGCIAVSLSLECDARGYAVERSQEALPFLEKNVEAAEGRIKIVKGDMFSEQVLSELGSAQLVISNPPYVTASEMEMLGENVKREPREALFGGDDGLDYYRKIAKIYRDKLTDGGMIAFEVGFSQAQSVGKILKDSGYREIRERCDINGVRRALCAIK